MDDPRDEGVTANGSGKTSMEERVVRSNGAEENRGLTGDDIKDSGVRTEGTSTIFPLAPDDLEGEKAEEGESIEELLDQEDAVVTNSSLRREISDARPEDLPINESLPRVLISIDTTSEKNEIETYDPPSKPHLDFVEPEKDKESLAIRCINGNDGIEPKENVEIRPDANIEDFLETSSKAVVETASIPDTPIGVDASIEEARTPIDSARPVEEKSSTPDKSIDIDLSMEEACISTDPSQAVEEEAFPPNKPVEIDITIDEACISTGLPSEEVTSTPNKPIDIDVSMEEACISTDSGPHSDKDDSAPFQIPLIFEPVEEKEVEAPLESSSGANIGELEKESLDAALEIANSLTEVILRAPEKHKNDDSKTETIIIESKEIFSSSGDSDLEVINETSSEDDDEEDIDSTGPKESLSFNAEEDEQLRNTEDDEFNRLLNKIHPEAETAIMEEVEDEFVRESTQENEGIDKDGNNSLNVINETEKSNTDINTKSDEIFLNEQAKDDIEAEEISKIVDFIQRTSKNNEQPQEEVIEKKKAVKRKSRNKPGRPRKKFRQSNVEKKIIGKEFIDKEIPSPALPKTVKEHIPSKTIEEQREPACNSSQINIQTDWEKVVKVKDPYYDKALLEVLYLKNIPGINSYVPFMPPNTSQRCIDALSSWDLEELICPGCADKFLIPTSFFEHLYRQSCEINFECGACAQVRTFYNRCALRVHVLSHLEMEKDIPHVDLHYASLRAPFKPPDNVENDLDFLKNELFNQNKRQCSECRLPVQDLESHFSYVHYVKTCETCSMKLPNPCSLAAHIRIHKEIGPLVCPECGLIFETRESFKEHVTRFCFHENRILAQRCRICECRKGPKDLPLMEVSGKSLSHVYEDHIKLLYKCSFCSKAFISKAAALSHRLDQHSDVPDRHYGIADFSLLYKASFLSKKLKLFGGKESFEKVFLPIMAKWRSKFYFKCPSCTFHFENKDEIRDHNIRWCMLQNGGGKDQPEKESFLLFPDNASLVVNESTTNYCFDKECQKCAQLKEEIKAHQESSHKIKSSKIEEGNIESQESPSNGERRLTRLRRRLSTPIAPLSRSNTPDLPSPNSLQEVSELIPVEKQKDENHSKSLLTESSRKKRLKSKDSKPIVEVLGLGVPSERSLLSFNRLSKKALNFGSTVVPKRVRTSLHNCSLCEFKSNDRISFLYHIREHTKCYNYASSGASSFQCKECGMSFASEPSWKKHLFLIHRIRNPSPADYCADLNTDNNGDKLIIDESGNKCSVCERSFGTLAEMKKHFRGHGMAYLKAQNKAM